jgi:hypothetical protein
MKKLIVIFTVSLIGITGCDAYTSNVSNKTIGVLQSKLDSDANFAKYKMRVVNVQLVSEGISKFEGIAKIEFEGKNYDIPVSVSSDLSSILVQTKPGGFLFLLEKEISQAQIKMDKDIAEGQEKFQKDMDEAKKDFEQKFEVLKEKNNQ